MKRLNYTNEMTLHLKLNMRLNMSFLWTYGVDLSVFFFCTASSVQYGLQFKFSLAPSETLAPGKRLRGEGCIIQVFCNGSPKHESNFSPYDSTHTEVVF